MSTSASGAFVPANRPFDVSRYRVTLEIDPLTAGERFEGEVAVWLKATRYTPSVVLDTDELTIQKVTLLKGGKPLAFRQVEGKVVEIDLPTPSAKGREWALKIAYQGKIRSAHYGFFRVTDPDEPDRGPLLFTHLEPNGARAVFPCNDEPYDKAITEVVATVPARNEVLSNGRRVSDKKVKRGKAQWRTIHWEMDKPHPTYLFALAIGPFSKTAVHHGKTEISAWMGATKTEKTPHLLESTKQAMAYFEEYLGVRYPWNKYAIVGLPTFLWGGMENTTSTHQNQDRSLLNDPKSEIEKRRIAGLTAHELAHQWFGDSVTMAWWDDIWLNESFASFMDTLAVEKQFKNDQGSLEFIVDTWDQYFRQEDGPRSHPIVDKNLKSADDGFDSINYTKGQNVLRMLRYYVGEQKFRKGLTLYLSRYAYRNADNQDFFTVMEKASAEKLDQFRDSWIFQRGYPVVTYDGAWENTRSFYRLKAIQRPNHPEDKFSYRFRMPVAFHRKATPAYSKVVMVEMGLKGNNETEIATSLPAAPEWVSINPGGIALAKVIPAKRDEGLLAAQALGDPDSLARVWATFQLLDGLTTDGQVSDFSERTVAEVLKTDNSPYVRIAVLSFFDKPQIRKLPPVLGNRILESTKLALGKDYESSALFHGDVHGWRQWRAELLGALGKVQSPEALAMLSDAIAKPSLGLDDLAEASIGIAKIGDDRGADLLKQAQKVHGGRGYRFQFAVQYALGAYENTKAVAEIRELSKTAGSDLLGRIGWLIRDNGVLRESSEWATFLKDFTLTDTRTGDEIKARLLETVEDVRTADVKATYEALLKDSKSERIRELAKKTLEKNFGVTPDVKS